MNLEGGDSGTCFYNKIRVCLMKDIHTEPIYLIIKKVKPKRTYSSDYKTEGMRRQMNKWVDKLLMNE